MSTPVSLVSIRIGRADDGRIGGLIIRMSPDAEPAQEADSIH